MRLAAVLAAAGARRRDDLVVASRSFALLDDQGRTRGVLHVNKKGPGLALLGPDGQTRADIRASDDGSSVIQLAGVGDWDKGLPLVQLNILDGKPGLGLFTNNLKGPEFMTYAGRPDQATCLFTNEGKRWLTVGLDKSGEPDIQVFGKDAKAIFDLRKATGARSDNKR